jgi:ABC-type branched-subunit amino acid transport system permease subunit
LGNAFDLDNKRVFYYFTLACLLGVYLFLRRLLFSPFGRALAGIRVNEHRMRAMGYGTFGYKLAAFTLAGALAGLAGYLWGAQTGYVNPELMGFHMSAHAIMMVILGGMGNFAGAIVGAFAFEYVLHVFKDLPMWARCAWASTGSCGWACSSCCWWSCAARHPWPGREVDPRGGTAMSEVLLSRPPA